MDQVSPTNTILIVDDAPENVTILQQILTANGFQVQITTSGEEALEEVKGRLPDLILLDIVMPGLDGYEVCKQLKAERRTKSIPVIFISALNAVEDKMKAFSEGGVDYIAKPFNVPEVLARVSAHLKIHSLQRSLKEKNSELAGVVKKIEQQVAERTLQLDQKNERLEETNVALKVLLEKREEDKEELEEKILFNIEKLISPYIDKLRSRCIDNAQEALLDIIQTNLSEITSSFANNSKDFFSYLTPSQIQIADLIKQGKTTKEIASLLNLSASTVACQRQEIRKRLSLTNKKVNLRTVLISSRNN